MRFSEEILELHRALQRELTQNGTSHSPSSSTGSSGQAWGASQALMKIPARSCISSHIRRDLDRQGSCGVMCLDDRVLCLPCPPSQAHLCGME